MGFRSCPTSFLGPLAFAMDRAWISSTPVHRRARCHLTASLARLAVLVRCFLMVRLAFDPPEAAGLADVRAVFLRRLCAHPENYVFALCMSTRDDYVLCVFGLSVGYECICSLMNTCPDACQESLCEMTASYGKTCVAP